MFKSKFIVKFFCSLISFINSQPYQFLLVENVETKKLLTPHSWNQPQIEQCSHLIVFTALKNIDEEYIDNFIKLTAKTRSIPESNLAEYKKMMIDNLIY